VRGSRLARTAQFAATSKPSDKVKGAIRATRVMLMESADVAGDIFYDRMSMEEGAHFVGASNAGQLPCTASPPDEKIS